ncbi:subtilisin-like protein [Pleomassaria siparia CBS 279.74]|uniref:tripeptidyl-peptidase II n=1 Tax=Pleomassaria siparia CBS 279.74 TaxID=1314801 RepID=A0A6G1JWW5_9PLEO|nr:subtilisin-like protein [Pleomassaria siparia CBS 279.74]
MRAVLSTLLSAAVAVQTALATPIKARSPYTVKERFNAPREWTKLDRAHGEGILELQIGLVQGNFDELERHLYEVSDPAHPRYGKHLSPEDVDELVKPKKESSDLVHEWLAENGIQDLSYSSAKDWIIVRLPVERVESLLDTEYHNYQHADGHVVARTTRWSLPRHLHAHIDTVQPTTSFFRTAANAATLYEGAAEVPASYRTPSNSSIAAVCNVTSVTPDCFATLYSTKAYQPKALVQNSVGFANYLGEIPIRPDTAKFLAKYAPASVSSAATFKAYSIDNGPVQDGPLTYNQSTVDGISREANLDVQAIAGISKLTPITSYSTGGEPPFIPDIGTPTNTNEPYLAWVNWLLKQKSIPRVISTSYGEPEQTIPRSYAERVCKQFAQVGARGTTLFFSSGDSGIGGTNKCYSNDGNSTYKFLPNFPASCPYVTTVGATMNFQPEVAVYRAPRNVSGVLRDFYAGGSGFSEYFTRPKYQDTVVPKYLDGIGELYKGLYEPKGRAYPDLAAQGLYFAYVWNGTEGVISGTSASTPLTAGIFSLVNDALLASGKSPLGFLNPWLYSKGSKGFTDITNGTSHGCNVDGFPATKGWDPVTGFGTPIFPELVKLSGAKGW